MTPYAYQVTPSGLSTHGLGSTAVETQRSEQKTPHSSAPLEPSKVVFNERFVRLCIRLGNAAVLINGWCSAARLAARPMASSKQQQKKAEVQFSMANARVNSPLSLVNDDVLLCALIVMNVQRNSLWTRPADHIKQHRTLTVMQIFQWSPGITLPWSLSRRTWWPSTWTHTASVGWTWRASVSSTWTTPRWPPLWRSGPQRDSSLTSQTLGCWRASWRYTLSQHNFPYIRLHRVTRCPNENEDFLIKWSWSEMSTVYQ